MNLIVAVDENWAIGKGGDQLVYISADLKRFKELTTGHPVILGRKTLATFPGGRPLKNRRNLILSATSGYSVEGAEVYPDVDSLLTAAPEDAFVIGGESVYRRLFEATQRVYVTKIEACPQSDAYFPDLDALPGWHISEPGDEREHEGIKYRFMVYERD